jgi:hypothetical protein
MADRASVFNNPNVIKLIQKHCIPVTHNNVMQSGYEGEEAFWEKTRAQGMTRPNCFFVCSASGVVLKGSIPQDLLRAVYAFQKLPESERKPVVRQEERGSLDANVGRMEPPPGGLIIRIYMRALARDKDGQLYVPKTIRILPYLTIPAEPQRDFLWLTKAEWQSIIRAEPRVGSTFPLPDSIRERIVRFHLIDACECIARPWKTTEVRDSKLALTVEESTLSRVRLRLDGSATVGENNVPPDEFQLAGFLTYDVQKKAFTQFDITAFSEAGHKIGRHYGPLTGKEKTAPMAIAFELAEDRPLERLPPRGTFVLDERRQYLPSEN